MNRTVATLLMASAIALISLPNALPANAKADQMTRSYAQQMLIRGQYQLASGANQAAMESLVTAVRYAPADMQMRRYLSEALIRNGFTVKAVEQMRLVINAQGSTPTDYAILGDAERYSGQHKEAILAYKEALRGAPMDSRARLGLAHCFKETGDLASAIELCRNSIVTVKDAYARREFSLLMDSLMSPQSPELISAAASVH